MARPYTDEERKKLKKKFLKLYKENYALMYDACDKMNVSRETIYNWMESDEEFKKKVEHIKERVGDIVEGKLMEKILQGNTASIMFYLKTQRHWKETSKVEVESIGDVDVKAAIEEIKKQMDVNE